MLGADFLTHYGCQWNFVDRTISFSGGSPIPLFGSQVAACRRVYLQDDVVLPAKTQAYLPARTTVNPLASPKGHSMLDAHVLSSGVYAARTLLPP